jgi:hypothetical protein
VGTRSVARSQPVWGTERARRCFRSRGRTLGPHRNNASVPTAAWSMTSAPSVRGGRCRRRQRQRDAQQSTNRLFTRIAEPQVIVNNASMSAGLQQAKTDSLVKRIVYFGSESPAGSLNSLQLGQRLLFRICDERTFKVVAGTRY